MTPAVDPITLEVVCEGLIAIVREMRATVIRASYSPVIWDMDDSVSYTHLTLPTTPYV